VSEGTRHARVRAELLVDQGRWAEAERSLREALVQEPNDAEALFLLAACQYRMDGREKDALGTIERAIAVEPAESSLHALRAMILGYLRKPAEAHASARQAIELDPQSTYAWMAQAQVYMNESKWKEAEESARTALAIDPEHDEAGRILAETLRLQGRTNENVAEVARILERDPESAPNHAAAGWAALQRGDRKAAEAHFLEALRIRPDTESAREGLLASLKARSPVYRAYLAYAFFMQRLAPRMQWVVIIGLLVGVRVARNLLTGPLAPLGLLVGALYFFFVLWVHLASGVGHLMVWLDRTARHALRPREAVDGLVVGGFATLGLPLAILGALFGSMALAAVGVTLVASAIPLAYAFVNDSPAGRIFFGASGAIALVTGLGISAGIAGWLPASPVLGAMLVVSFILVMLSTWLSNVRALNR
jgi:Tfp pilus assembly protein PilF